MHTNIRYKSKMDFSTRNIEAGESLSHRVDNSNPFESDCDETECSLCWQNVTVRTTAKSANSVKKVVRKLTGRPEVEEQATLEILKSATGYAEAGQMIAVMGPSGAGKTTLLGALAKRIRPTSGTIKVNGVELTAEEILKISSFVPQFDPLPDALTTAEYVAFSCALRLDVRITPEERKVLANDIIMNLSLGECKDSLIRTLSGGEKKRLSLAAEIVTKPQILYLDEPTTGLDTFAALQVVESIKPISSSGIVICSIHQPSMMIYNLFSHVIFLSNGNTAFFGNRKDARTFFERLCQCAFLVEGSYCHRRDILSWNFLCFCQSASRRKMTTGFRCPYGFDEAEYYVKILSNRITNIKRQDSLSGPTGEDHSSRICRAYRDSEFAKIPSFSQAAEIRQRNNSAKSPRWIVQFAWLTWRLYHENRRTLADGLIAFNYYAISVALVMVFFWGIDTGKEQGVQDVMGVLYMVSAETVFSTAYTPLWEIEREIPIFMRESAMYGPSAYHAATLFSWLPKTILKSFILTIVLFAILGTRSTFFPIFFEFFACAVASGVCGLAYGSMVASFIEDNEMATIVMVPIDLLALLMSGIYYNLWSLKWYTVGFKYLSIFYYTNEGLAIAQWSRVSHIECKNDSDSNCISTGAEVLLRYGYEESNFWMDIVGMTLLTFVMCFIGYLGMKRRRSLKSEY